MHKQERCSGLPDGLCHEAEFVLATHLFDELILSDQLESKVRNYLGAVRWCIFLGAVDLLNPKSRSLKHLSLAVVAGRIRHSKLVKVIKLCSGIPSETNGQSQCGFAAQRTAIPAPARDPYQWSLSAPWLLSALDLSSDKPSPITDDISCASSVTHMAGTEISYGLGRRSPVTRANR